MILVRVNVHFAPYLNHLQKWRQLHVDCRGCHIYTTLPSLATSLFAFYTYKCLRCNLHKAYLWIRYKTSRVNKATKLQICLNLRMNSCCEYLFLTLSLDWAIVWKYVSAINNSTRALKTKKKISCLTQSCHKHRRGSVFSRDGLTNSQTIVRPVEDHKQT